MNFLALDTSSDACSVALVAGERQIERHRVRPREHTRLLLPMIREVLEEAAVAPAALAAIVLGNGPGSFIGIRIAASVAQGLAHGAGIPLVPVSSLAAVAAEALQRSRAPAVLVLQDAHMGEVYAAGFRRGADGLPAPLGPSGLHPVAAPLALPWPARGECLAAGAGWQRYPELYERARAELAGRSEALLPRAAFLLGLGRRAFRAGEAVPPDRLELAYLRTRVARTPDDTPP